MTGEVIAFPSGKTITKASRQRKPKHTWSNKVAACLSMAELLPPKEVEFLQSMSDVLKCHGPTAKQAKWIDDIIRRLREWNEDSANG